MHIRQLRIQNFRGIESADIRFAKHTLLVGENNIGKTTVLEAINLALGPDRAGRVDSIDEHDFFLRRYEQPPAAEEGMAEGEEGATAAQPEIRIEIILDGLNDDQLSRFREHVELWNEAAGRPYSVDEIGALPEGHVEQYVLPILFQGRYDPDEDEFSSQTCFAKGDGSGQELVPLSRRDKLLIGFLYLRGYRTATRAASLERGSLLDILLDLRGARPRVWESVLKQLDKLGNTLESDDAFRKVLTDVETRIDRFLPRRGEAKRRSALYVSDLTRRELRGVMTYFLESAAQDHLVPLSRLGSGTTNVLVLALLSAIAETKANVIFGMEEPETALPPFTQRRILKELIGMSVQTIVTSHSPYVAERYLDEEILVLRKNGTALNASAVQRAGGIDPKRLRQDFRIRYAEGLVSNAVLLCEGISDRAAFAEVNQKLAALEGTSYVDLDILGVTVVPVDGTGKEMTKVATFYKALGMPVYSVSDALSGADLADLEAVVEWHECLPEGSLEKVLSRACVVADIQAFLREANKRSDWPGNLALPAADTDEAAWRTLFCDVLKTRKGDEYSARFLADLPIDRVPRCFIVFLARAASASSGRLYARADALWALLGADHRELFEPEELPENA